MLVSLDNAKIAVIGLGYVGLPLAIEFSKKRPTVGFDINTVRIEALQAGHDATREVDSAELADASHLTYSSALEDLSDCNVFIVTVPTPVDRHNRPDLTPLVSASESIGKVLKIGDVVIYESTVYPGATEEDCVPVLERASGLRFNEDFFVGYSPERINPGDKRHRLTTIKKVTSGSTPEIASFVDTLYASIIKVGTYKAPSIRVAEAAKVIENTQRDLNIALINELAMLFNHLEIDTEEVLKAAETKWNFLGFRPGLVGGHCIGVDPYYLTHKAEEVGYHPQIILGGRRVNDRMGSYVSNQMAKAMLKRKLHVRDARILIMGLTFKENCPDLRNTKVIDIARELGEFGCQVEIYDPWAVPAEAQHEYGVSLVETLEEGVYDGILVAVGHAQFAQMGAAAIRALGREGCVLYDVKSILAKEDSDLRL